MKLRYNNRTYVYPTNTEEPFNWGNRNTLQGEKETIVRYNTSDETVFIPMRSRER